MAHGTRGKLKENLEGIHRNCDWIRQHCVNSVKLLPEGYEELRKSYESLHDIAVQLDEFAQSIYSKI